ncbi:cobalt ECF transporter T component CbiQ [Rhodospirillaceae bacterium KN72]|uniref:Cobalt ECF transporter T component CbiQ n=1 Tax=Pacificispira spongiicola TaxID=2729598 RepID=A0A7Y0HCY1_9PROT|nr:cobalt ECF transporter T component CbiQ [Pacificispira spongiicola]NMM43070.1 cobalt ECF transporter T component CbiQ [Pacificispira spongiicola]
MGHVLSKSEKTLKASGAPDAQGSFVSGIDPRLRIVAAVAYAVVAVACHWIPVLVLALGVSLCVMLAECLPIARTLKRMAAMDSFIIFLLLLLPFTVPGEQIFTVWGFTASWEGVHQAVTIALKANAIVLMLMVLVGTLEAVTFGHALHALRVPAALVHLLLFTVRYVEVLHEEYLRLRQAMKARGFKPSNCLHTYRSFGYLVGMMLVRALERSERILDAMKCRGFTGAIPLLAKFELSRRDSAFAVLMGVVMGSFPVLEYLYGAV